ncbi:MAG: DNA-deoxyinosine glycosylase [Lachnospiraceae bacterium]|nr:DNA-deoxyinosine glycosylase [Lachnospiraceae bacterium]
MGNYERVRHEFPPVYNENSRILILGSLPSVKSREQMFYYGHPQNRFWKVIAGLTGASVPSTIPEKKALLLAQGIAVSDVIAECDIIGSSDSSIRNVIPMDLQEILENAKIRQIYANGNTAKKLFERFQQKSCQRDIIGLPSTSPANTAYSLDRLIEAWTCIL